MTWLTYWFGLATGFVLGVIWSVAMYVAFYRPRRIRVPRAVLLANAIEGDGRARWPWRRR